MYEILKLPSVRFMWEDGNTYVEVLSSKTHKAIEVIYVEDLNQKISHPTFLLKSVIERCEDYYTENDLTQIDYHN